MSYWEHTSLLYKQDIIVIGAGITGTQAAIHAKKLNPRRSVMILERAPIPSGASTKNAGFACMGSLTEIAEDIRAIGADRTFALMERRYQGLQILRSSVPDEVMDFHQCGGTEVFRPEDDQLFSQAAEVRELANRAIESFTGTSNAFVPWTNAPGFPGVDRGFFTPIEGQLNPALMMEHLHGVARSLGVKILTGVEVTTLNEEDPRGIAIYTVELGEILTDQLMIAINGFANDLLSDLDLRPVRNQVLVTEEIPVLNWEGTFHYDRGYVYFRNIGKRLLIGGFRNHGGEAEETDRFGITDQIGERQLAFIQEVLGLKVQVAHRWSGILGVGESREPIVKEVYPGVFAVVRLGGMGVALGSLLGKEVAEMLH